MKGKLILLNYIHFKCLEIFHLCKNCFKLSTEFSNIFFLFVLFEKIREVVNRTKHSRQKKTRKNANNKKSSVLLHKVAGFSVMCMRNLLSPYCLESASQFFPRCVFPRRFFAPIVCTVCMCMRVENISALGDLCLFCCLIPFPMPFRFRAECSFGGGVSGRIIRMVDRKHRTESALSSTGKSYFEIEAQPPYRPNTILFRTNGGNGKCASQTAELHRIAAQNVSCVLFRGEFVATKIKIMNCCGFFFSTIGVFVQRSLALLATAISPSSGVTCTLCFCFKNQALALILCYWKVAFNSPLQLNRWQNARKKELPLFSVYVLRHYV